MTQQIEYWFTAGSTYNYLTAQRIGQACGQAGVPLVLNSQGAWLAVGCCKHAGRRAIWAGGRQ